MKTFLFIGVLAAVIAMPVVAQETPIRNSADTTHHIDHKKAQHDRKAKAKQALKTHKENKKHKKLKKRSAVSEN